MNLSSNLDWIWMSAFVGLMMGTIITVVVGIVALFVHGRFRDFARTIIGGLAPAVAIAVSLLICGQITAEMPDWIGMVAMIVVALSTAMAAFFMGDRLSRRPIAPASWWRLAIWGLIGFIVGAPLGAVYFGNSRADGVFFGSIAGGILGGAACIGCRLSVGLSRITQDDGQEEKGASGTNDRLHFP